MQNETKQNKSLFTNELKETRLKICEICEFKKTKIKIDYCGKCGCPLATKTLVPLSKCPIGKW